jgi:peptidoglycan/LPS O-acetylase OafA/YrhL
MHSPIEHTERIASIDGLRGWAALTVVMSHIVGGLGIGDAPFLASLPVRLAWDGVAAVAAFFVLSGFVLCLPFRHRATSFKLFANTTMSYWIRRAFRIYPSHIVVIAACIPLVGLVENRGLLGWSPWLSAQWVEIPAWIQILKNFVMLAPETDTHVLNPVIWTLVVELKIGIIFPIIALIGETGGAVALLVATLVLGNALLWLELQGTWIFLFQFMLGALLFQLCRHKSTHSFIFGAMTLAAAMLLYWIFHICDNKEAIAAQIVIGISFFFLIGAAIVFSPFSRILETYISQLLGQISFTLYLVHLPVLLLFARFFSPTAFPTTVAFCLGYVLCSITLAYCLTRMIEKPFIRKGRQIANDYCKLRLIARR